MELSSFHLQSLFVRATEGILVTNSRGIMELVNPAAELIFGYKEDELIGKPVELLIPERFHAHHTGLRQEFYSHPSHREMGTGRDLFGRKKDGTDIPVEISLSHYKVGDELFVTAFIVDITRRKEAEQRVIQKQKELERVTNQIRKLNTELELRVEERTHILKEALQKLEQSQNELHKSLDKERQLNEIKSRFVSMASHEFRTPLSAVLSSASLLSRYTGADEQAKRDRHINRIKDSVKHLNDILEDFLSLGKLDEGRIEADLSSFNLSELVEEIMADMSLLLKKGQQLNCNCEGEIPVYSDKRLLKNIMINLVSNAIKFSGENSPIDILIDAAVPEAVIRIRDHGIGISKEDQKHLFSSFFRGSNAANIQGTGLGLHIVKRYVDLLTGTVHLQSEQGAGTTVTVRFPITKNNT